MHTMPGSGAFVPLIAAALLAGCAPREKGPTTLELVASDGVTVHATHYPAEHPRGIVLLFHQAGSSSGEYRTIAPRLAATGYDALAIDQRSGGDLFGPNRTVAGIGRSAGYLEAEPDLEAAFAWGRTRRLPVLILGSSYSAALAFRLAARHPGEVQALLAFSPGEYLGRPEEVRRAAARVSAPLFVSAASHRTEQTAARALLEAAPASIEVAHLPPEGGVHGASTLIAARNPRGAEAAWRAVEGFLARVR